MKDRIIQFIESEKISAAEFADRIGVQRSSVSHVLNGRNNPGFSFIQKILETYPKLNSRWLILGEESMYSTNTIKNQEVAQQQNLFSQKQKTSSEKENIIIDRVEATEKQTHIPSEVIDLTKIQHNKEIVRVLIFYTDQTFDDFRPAK